MSNKVKRMSQEVTLPASKEVDTKSVVYAINVVCIFKESTCKKVAYVNVSGIPKEHTKEDYDAIAKHTAETMFYNVLNSRVFLELYDPGESSKTSNPRFYNLRELATIEVESVEEINL